MLAPTPSEVRERNQKKSDDWNRDYLEAYSLLKHLEEQVGSRKYSEKEAYLWIDLQMLKEVARLGYLKAEKEFFQIQKAQRRF